MVNKRTNISPPQLLTQLTPVALYARCVNEWLISNLCVFLSFAGSRDMYNFDLHAILIHHLV